MSSPKDWVEAWWKADNAQRSVAQASADAAAALEAAEAVSGTAEEAAASAAAAAASAAAAVEQCPTADQKAALAGTDGTPNDTNRYVTDSDSRLDDSRAPTGAASGDLGETYPSPTVVQARGLREASGPTTLVMSTVADGHFLKRSGSTIIGEVAGGASPLTTKGDLYIHDASAETRLGVSGNDGYVLRESSGATAGLAWGQLTLDDVLAAFAVSGAVDTTEKEIGDTLTSPTASATFNRNAAAATVNDGTHGALAMTLGVPPTTASKVLAYSYSSSTIGAVVTFTVTANETGGPGKTSAPTCTWKALTFWCGRDRPDPATYNEAFIEALTSSDLMATRVGTYAVSAPGTNRFYIALPTSYGSDGNSFYSYPSGLPASMTKVASAVSCTNAFAVATNYDVWESDETGWGTATLEVR